MRRFLLKAAFRLTCLACLVSCTPCSPSAPGVGAAGNTASPPAVQAAPPNPYFAIHVVDQQTGRGVPLVELSTANHVSFFTDSAGLIAFHEPGLMDQKACFHIRSPGYQPHQPGPHPGLVTLCPVAGGQATIPIKRLNIAQRLYRITGAGIYRDSVLLGLNPPTAHPLLNGLVAGQDSVLAVPYRGKIYWFWGDTIRMDGPTWGQFRTGGATSELPGHGGLDPSVGVDLHYFVDPTGFSKPMCPLPDRKTGSVWIDGVMTLPAPSLQTPGVPGVPGVSSSAGPTSEILVCHYSLVKPIGWDQLEQGLMVFDDKSQTFQRYERYAPGQRHCPSGHPTRWRDGGEDYEIFASPFPTLRVKADFRAVADPHQYEVFTCLPTGGHYNQSKTVLQRDAEGNLLWGWKRDADPISQKQERELIAAGKIKPQEARFQIRDVVSHRLIDWPGGSLCYNAYRHKWIMIGCSNGPGPALLDQIWFTEADQPTGPWRWAWKIVSYDNYSFYNPAQHPFFDQAGGRLIYFEGTYSNTFAKNAPPTPRYDYNQIMYCLDLSDPRLKLPTRAIPVETGHPGDARPQ